VSEPLSKSQIERLGVRLTKDGRPADADLELLHDMLADYSEVLSEAIIRVRDGLGVAPTSRIKNTGTILEKLDRHGGSWLKSLQDLAGMRIVGEFDRAGQDALVDQLVELFADEVRKPKVVDRRAEPTHGYSAVHVIVFPQGRPIEIQVRTPWQHEWAEMFEKLADRVGRNIRYGEPPSVWWSNAELEEMSDPSRDVVLSSYELRRVMVDLAQSVAGMIDALEIAEVLAPSDPAIAGYRADVQAALVSFRERVERL